MALYNINKKPNIIKMTSGEIGPLSSFPHFLLKGLDIEAAQKWNERSIKEIKEDMLELHSLVSHLPSSAHPEALIERAEKLVSSLEGRISQQSPTTKTETLVREIFIREALTKELSDLKKALVLGKTEKEHHLFDKISLLHQHNQERLLKIKPSDHDAKAFKQLSSIHDNREVMEGSKNQPSLSQIQALDQYTDGTPSSGENRGYHALKNALLALSPEKESIETAFKDQKLFQSFYQRYCAPLIAEAPHGKRDATIPRLDEIMNLIKTDPAPPKELMAMHKVLTNKETAQSVAVFQMSTTTGDDRGDPLMAFLDSRAVIGAKQLYNLAIQPGPRTLSAVFGDESIGHWYTLVIHKDEKGELHFLGCDSMDNEHDRIGSFSPLAKMVRLIALSLSDPSTLIEKGYAPLDDVISPRAGWIDSDLGEIDSSNVSTLLDATPNVGFATKDYPNKSYQDWVIEHCILAYDLAETGSKKIIFKTLFG